MPTMYRRSCDRMRHPRTLDEAFPYGPDYGNAITQVHKGTSWADWLVGIACALSTAALALILMLE